MSKVVSLVTTWNDTASDDSNSKTTKDAEPFDPISDKRTKLLLRDYFKFPVSDLVVGDNKKQHPHYAHFPPVYYCRASEQLMTRACHAKLMSRTPHCMAVLQLITAGWIWDSIVSYYDIFRLMVENSESFAPGDVEKSRTETGRHNIATFGNASIGSHVAELVHMELVVPHQDSMGYAKFAPTRLTVYRYLETALWLAQELQFLLSDHRGICDKLLDGGTWLGIDPSSDTRNNKLNVLRRVPPFNE